jgi:hypothetical protein
MKMSKLVCFDIESNGLHGLGFAAGAVVLENGEATHRFEGRVELSSYDPWVRENVLPHLQSMTVYPTVEALREAFWKFYKEHKEGSLVLADVGWPVEANWLSACVEQMNDPWGGPYPLHEVATLLLAAGENPDATREDLVSKLPAKGAKHHPLWDAEISAKVAYRYLKR